MEPTILTTAEAAEVLRVPVGTLRYWRHQGTGPKSFKLGAKRVAYMRDDVEAWLRAQYEAGDCE
ncbi:helix-turn-helix domain-containing protein [Dermacoccus sp. PAMC28757]|uniref:helix-turn-helix transcriptional regulator n=1 Tax=Dermacoccus sp. PAMC28757 TaxID=2762331 RepID=UPI00164E740F|nr:helix-turn-helix domain-containing protein [Dermacoccus sp. PAMC28757]QNK52349.1 helix-turn-helix domain-containing protein [Dermacoccus sp. PAMC28757]